MVGGSAFARAASGGRVRFLLAVAVVAAVVLGMTSAAWACHPLLSGVARCSSSGDQVVTWTIGNSQNDQSMTITAATANVGATTYAVVGYSTVVRKGESTSATSTVPSRVTGTIGLTVTGAWRHHVVATRQASVALGGVCAPTTTTTTTTTPLPPPTTTTTVAVTTTTTTTRPAVTTTTTTLPTPTTVTPTTETPTTVVVQTVTTVAPTTVASTTSTSGATIPPTTASTTSSTVRSQGSPPRPISSGTPPRAGTLPFTGSSGLPLWMAIGSAFVGVVAFALLRVRISLSVRHPER